MNCKLVKLRVLKSKGTHDLQLIQELESIYFESMKHWQSTGGFKQFDTEFAPVDDLATICALSAFQGLALESNVPDCAKLLKYVMARKSKFSFKIVTAGITDNVHCKLIDAYALYTVSNQRQYKEELLDVAEELWKCNTELGLMGQAQLGIAMLNLKLDQERILAQQHLVTNSLDAVAKQGMSLWSTNDTSDIAHVEGMALALRFLLLHQKACDVSIDNNNTTKDKQTTHSNLKITADILSKLEQQVVMNRHRFSLHTWSTVLEALAEAADLYKETPSNFSVSTRVGEYMSD